MIDINLNHLKNKTIALAISGGVDSMALAHLLHQNNINFTALTVNHNLRKEALDEVEFIKSEMDRIGIKTEIFTLNEQPKNNIQNWARNERYKLLANYCIEHKIDTLLTAHHKDDQVETILQRIARGSGIRGLVGIKENVKINNVNIHRPLLNISKSELIYFMQIHNNKWVEDKSNESDKYKRNKLRHALAQISDSKDELENRLIKLSKNATRAEDFIESEVNKFIENNPLPINSRNYAQTHEEITLRALTKLTMQIGKVDILPREEKLIRAHNNILQGTPKFTFNKCIIEIKNGAIDINPEH